MPVPRLSKVMGERVRDIAGGRRLYADDCTLLVHDFPSYHGQSDRRAALAVHQLPAQVIERRKAERVEINQNQVGLMSDADLPDGLWCAHRT